MREGVRLGDGTHCEGLGGQGGYLWLCPEWIICEETHGEVSYTESLLHLLLGALACCLVVD